LKQETAWSTTTLRVTNDPRYRRRMPPKPRFFRRPEEFRAWLEVYHEEKTELLVGFYKRGSGRASLTWPESVDEALSFGWIDGVRKGIDDSSYTIRFTPRRPKSIWSAINVARVGALTKQGRMRPAGLAAFALRTPERTGVYSFERTTDATLTDDEERTLRASRSASAYFDAQAPGYRRVALHWVTSAKREDTRARRLATLIESSEAGLHVPPLRRAAPAKTKAKTGSASRPARGRARPAR
jgi:uncharacterized protein YdeI (YjbR/CyaY-like superfamily)